MTWQKLFDLKGKVAVITGGAGMLGQQHAEVLSDAGAHVVIADISQQISDPVAERITKRNNIEALGVEVDITSEASVNLMVDKIIKKFSRVDILINNAAVKPKNIFNAFEDYQLEDWEEVMRVDLGGMFICSKIIGQEMVKRGGGVIVNIGSIYGMVGTDQSIYGTSGINAPAVYAAAKGGVINLTRYLATYWAKKNIRVNCLSPGGVSNQQDPGFVERYCAKTPLGRMAAKDDFKAALLFLVGSGSSYMTGANLVVDGGWTAW